MARNPKVELRGHEGQVVHPITDGDCVIFPSGETLSHKLSEQEEVMYAPEVTNSSPMFKVGEGDSSDYSANVLDGAYQEAILKGQTYVNTIQEPSADVITLPTPFTEYERTQSKTFTEMQDGTFGLNLVGQSYVNCIQEPSEPSYVALGENLEFQNKKVEYTNDGQIKSAMLKGQTLVNLASTATLKSKDGGSGTFVNGKLRVNFANYIWSGVSFFNNGMMKPSTEYTLIAKATNTTSFSIEIGHTNGVYNAFIPVNLSRLTLGAGESGSIKIALTTRDDLQSNSVFYNIMASEDPSSYSGDKFIDVEIMIIEGDYTQEDIPYFEGMQSVTMTTELENVCSRYNSSGAKNGKTFTVGTSVNRCLYLSYKETISNYNFKQNTKYLMQFKITNLNLDGADYITLLFSDGTVASGNALFGDYTKSIKVTKNGVYRTVLTTSNIVSTSHFVIKGTLQEWEDTSSTTRKLTISQIMCIEYQNGMENWDLPYFETTQLMKPIKVQSISKNLFNPKLHGSLTINSDGTFTLNDSDWSKNIVTYKLKPNTTYKITLTSTRNPCWVAVKLNDNKADSHNVGSSNYYKEFTTDSSGIIQLGVFANTENNIGNIVSTIQLEEGSISTDYVVHQSKTTSALEPITLRAIGDVKDTLDLSTGEYVQRIGEVILDGSDDEKWKMSKNSNDTYRFDTTAISGKITWVDNAMVANVLCDKYKTMRFNHAFNNRDTGIAIYNNTHIIINNGGTDLATFKASLSQNPVKIQFELANPITRKISLEYPNLQTYTDITHVQSIAMDGTLIPKIYLPSDITYKAMLKPNTSYNVIVDREVIDSTNQLTVNLGGTTANITANRTIVTTPSTLSNETLTFSGKDNRIAKAMLIEGSTLINGDLPHFDGIGDVKLGRVVENLCMANEIVEGNGRTTDTYSNNSITSKFTASGSRVYLFNLIKPIQNGKKYFVYAPCSQTCAIGFKTIYNGASLYSVAKTSIDNYTILSIDNEILRECKLFIGQLEAMPVDTTMTIRRPILCEYVDGMENWDWESIGYFTGARNIGNEFMRINNKNLFDGINRKYYINVETYLMGLTNNDSGGVVDVSNVDNVVVSSTSTQTRFRIGCTNKLPSENGETVAVYNGVNLDNNSSAKASIDCSNYKYLIVNAVDLSIVQVEEATSATSYVAHKHNSLHILPNEQIPLTFEQGATVFSTTTSFTEQSNNTMTNRIRTGLLDLEPNETYRISCGDKNYIQATAFYNNSNIGAYTLGGNSDDCVFTTTKDVHKICINIAKSDMDANITPSVLHQVRLEKVTDVHLRSVGNVHDELDLTRGVYVQRIDEKILDGSTDENWELNSSYPLEGTLLCTTQIESMNGGDSNPYPIISCDKFSYVVKGYIYANQSISTYIKSIQLRVNNNIATTLEELKQYLQKNPITIQYILKTPIEHKIHIPMKNESNQTITKPNGVFTLPLMYSETNHVDINSQIYPKVQSRDYISYPVIANNSQLHTVFHNKLGTGNLTVNLCGTNVTSVDGTSKCTITTPSTISQYELRLSGARNKVSNVCVFSGDYMNIDVPYVEGMMNAVNPTVKNIGKNLFDGVVKNGESWWNGRVENGVASYRRSVNLTPVKPNTKYSYKLANGRGVNFMAHGKDGKFLKYIGWFPSDTSKFTTPSDCYYIHWYNEIDDFTDFYIEESSTPSQYEPYKENILKTSWSIGYNAMLKDKSISSANGASINNALNRYRTDFIKIDFAKIYINSNNPYYLFLYDINKKYLGRFTDSWVTDREFEFNESNAYYFIVVFKTDDGEDTTTYISSKETRITLRSLPNGVRDELNLETGEYIQRVGEVVLDGSKDNIQYYASAEGVTTSLFLILQDNVKNVTTEQNGSGKCYCDKFIEKLAWANSIDVESVWLQESNTNNILRFRIKKSKLQTVDNNGIKQYLSQNPITVQYELETPIIKQIDINNFPHSYKDGHVVIESNDPSTNVTAQMTYQCVANRTGQIQEHTEQIEKQEHEINELEMLILENIRQQQNR